MKQKFYKNEWWRDTITSLVGTVVGIVLTFGTTFYIEKQNKADMARKTVIITLHNLDVKIKSLKSNEAWMSHVDTLFRAVVKHLPADLDNVDTDTLRAAYDVFPYLDIHLNENIAESIFSTSIEVWEYMDDERAIGRISNCYSFSNYCEKIQEELQKERLTLFRDFLKEQKLVRYTPETAKAFLQRPEVQFHLSMHILQTGMMNRTLKLLVQMHERNKKELNISQAELDAAGELLTEEDYQELNES